MDLGAMQVKTRNATRRNAEDERSNRMQYRDTNMSQIKCFLCGQFGHVKRNCPNRKNV